MRRTISVPERSLQLPEPVIVIQTVPGEGIFVLMDGQRIAERGAGE